MAVQLPKPVQALNMDTVQQQSFIRYYNSLPEKPTTTVRFFNRVEYYTVHGEDARFCSVALFKNVVGVKVMGVDNLSLEYLCLNKNNFERLARILLLVKQYRAEVYVNHSSSKNNDWVIEYKGSPGNLAQFEDVLFEKNDIIVNCNIIAVKTGKDNSLGIACVDSNERTFSVCEFTDNEFFSELESLIIHASPRECILQLSNMQESNNVKSVLERSGITCMQHKKMDYNQSNITQDLNRLLHFEKKQQQNCHAYREVGMQLAMAGLHAIIKYLDLLSDDTNFGKYSIKVLDAKRCVHLDNAAVTALNILPKTGQKLNKQSSLLGLLDRCRTPQGHRLIAQWIKQPLRDINTINDRLDVVQVFVNDHSIRELLYNDFLRRMPDLLILSRRIMRKRAGLQDCHRIYQAIGKLPHIVSALRSTKNKTIDAMFVSLLNEFLGDMEKYQQMIETTIDLDMVDKGEFLVKPSFDEELAELDEKKRQLEEKIQTQLNTAARDLNLEPGKSIKLDYTEQLGYFFRITRKEEQTLRKQKEFIIITTLKGGIRFRNQKLESLNEDYKDARDLYQQQQTNIVTEIISIASGYSDTLKNISQLIAQLDVLLSFAIVSASAPTPFIRPKLLEEGSGVLKLTQIRHPCIEQQDNISYNPNDIEFKSDEQILHIITGPNMGGKSTYIRSVGVCVLLAQIGCFVPCHEAEISLVDSILARLGSSDCLSKGLSTFMLEMVETAGILRTATSNSLIIIDELGRGTSTYEGCGIAWAIVEHIATDIKAFTMFATHFHEITRLADEVPTVHNKHVTAMVKDDKLVLLYQVKPGSCDQSFGLHVAKMAGMDKEFIDTAQMIQNSLEDYRNIEELQKFDSDTRQQILKDGDKLIAEFLDKWDECKKKRMNEDEKENVLKKLKTEMTEKNNPYIHALLKEC